MKSTPRATLCALTTCFLTTAARADWPSNPAVNLPLADNPGEQTQPKLAPRIDGGCWVSWFDNETGGYDVTIGRLDAEGNEVLPHDGVLVADRGFSSTQDYGLDVHTSGDALLAFRDDRPAGTQITATRVAGNGTQPWGASGVQLTSTGDFVAAPKIAGTSDGNVVVAWTQETDVVLQQLDASGVPQWGAGVTLSPVGAGSYSASDLHDSGGGSVILSFVFQTGGFGSPRHLYAQKFDSAGNLLWGAGHVAVFDGGSLQVANFPTFDADGSGGGAFAWYEVSPLQCRAQRILSNGTEAFAHNGVPVSTNGVRIRVSPSVDFEPIGSSTFVFWTEQNALQSESGVYGQKLDVLGNRLWTDDGAVVRTVDSTERTQVRTAALGAGAMTFWVEGSFGSQQVFAARLNSAGALTVAPFAASSFSAGKSRLQAGLDALGFAKLTWVDTRADAGDVYAQNVNPDGTLGNALAVPLLPAWGMALFALGLLAFGTRRLARRASA